MIEKPAASSHHVRPGRAVLTALIVLLALAGCSALDTFMLPPEYRITPSPYHTPTRRPTLPSTATAAPLASPEPIPVSGPEWSQHLEGEIYFTLVDPASARPRLARLPAGCGPCPAPEILPSPPGGIDTPRALIWSPDEQQAALVVQDRLFLLDLQTETWKQLSELKVTEPRAAWSPDGDWIAFQALKDDLLGFFVVHPDGSGLKSITSGRLATVESATLSGWQGGRVVFIGGGPTDYYAYVTTLENPRPARLSDSPVFRGRTAPLPVMPISPDGDWVAYSEDNEQVGSIVTLVALKPATDPRMLLSSRDNRVRGYAWSPDAEWLAVWSDFDDAGQVERVRADASGLELVYWGEPVRSVVFAPDGSGALLVEVTREDAARLLYILPGQAGELEVSGEGIGENVSWRAPSWRPNPRSLP